MGFFDTLKLPRFSEIYEMGFPDISGPKNILFQFTDTHLELKIVHIFSSIKIIIKPDDIIEIGLNQETYRSAGKAAAGAIIGGVLTGGIGLLVGAALGGKRRKEGELTFIVNYKGNECQVFIKPSSNIPKIYAELKRLTSKQTIKPVEEKVEIQINETKPSIVNDLEKLYTLFEKGILTKEEFEIQKKKMLE
jgi:hypothetical protein